MAGPTCSCDGLPLSRLNLPCPVHGSKWNRDELVRLREAKDEAQLQEHMAKNAEARLRKAGDALAEATRARIRGDATTSVWLQALVDAWEAAQS